jgi:hypothetical protein
VTRSGGVITTLLPSSGGGFSPTSSQSAAFLARATDVTSITDKTRYDTMITGLVNDGVWSKLDALYIFATVDRATAVLNLVSSSFACVEHGTVSFSAYHGYTGDGSTFWLDTQFTPSTAGGNFSLNSASLFAYDLSNNTTENAVLIGGFNSQRTNLLMQPNFGQLNVIMNGNATANINVGLSNAQGFFVGTQTATLEGASRNGAAISTISAAPVGLENGSLAVFALANGAGAGVPNGFTTDQISCAGIGGVLTSTDVANLSSRINTYMTAYGINVY